jgi:DnaJ-class molecular chaperone
VVASAPPAKDVLRRYREMLRHAHPDHGASTEGAAQRIAELAEARRILTGR